uniref:hypothetical protein n=1 Tax=Bifidobacterium breve TaxID=1685 RepID=UPI00197AA002
IRRVVGRADTEPLLTSDPAAAPNRRLSITLLRQAPIPPKVAARKARQTPPPVVDGAEGLSLPEDGSTAN